MNVRRAIAVLVLSFPLLGMGMLGGEGAGGAPERNYEATFVDRDGTRVEVKWVTAGGELALTGELGRGSLRVSFDDIEKIDFSGGERDSSLAHVTLREGQAVDLKIRGSITFSGQTGLGLYKVRARDLKTIEFAKS